MCMCYHDDEFIMAVHVLFISDEWKCDPEFAQYLSELSAYSVEKLRELGSSTVLLVTVGSQLSELQLSKSSVIQIFSYPNPQNIDIHINFVLLSNVAFNCPGMILG